LTPFQNGLGAWVAVLFPNRRHSRYSSLPTFEEKNRVIETKEYSARRERVLKELHGAAAVVFSGEAGGHAPFNVDKHFFYLTGIQDEFGAAVLFDPSAEDPRRRIVLFLRPLNPELERWDGFRETISAALRKKSGFSSVMRAGSLPALLTAAAKRTKKLACLHQFAVYPAAVSPDVEAFRKVMERVPGVATIDQTALLPTLRASKSPAELKLMQQAVAATAAGYEAAMRLIKPGANESEIQYALESTYRQHGGNADGYESIVGCGLNGTVLHYRANDQVMTDGDLVVIDSAAAVGGYTADVTRTYPVNGKFSSEQREVYEIVLKALLAGIKFAKPGGRIHEIDAVTRDIINKAGFEDAYIHGAGHPIGLDVHEIPPDGLLREGMVITIEPGIYLPERQLGVRIEDDILITAKGSRNLTEGIVKTVNEIEAGMR